MKIRSRSPPSEEVEPETAHQHQLSLFYVAAVLWVLCPPVVVAPAVLYIRLCETMWMKLALEDDCLET